MSERVRTWLTGTPLLALGIGVLLFSLYATRVESAGTSFVTATPEPTEVGVQNNPSYVFDAKMPGSPLYTLERFGDRLEMMWVDEEMRIGEKLELVRERADAATYALEQGQTEQALLTYTKSFIYLHQATHECHELAQVENENAVMCARWLGRVTESAQYLQKSLVAAHDAGLNDSQRANLDRLLAQIGSLRLQFQL